jgi:hypothetical protein
MEMGKYLLLQILRDTNIPMREREINQWAKHDRMLPGGDFCAVLFENEPKIRLIFQIWSKVIFKCLDHSSVL